jgi:hypothetical protein
MKKEQKEILAVKIVQELQQFKRKKDRVYFDMHLLREVLYKAQGSLCHYCKNSIEEMNWSIDHRTPIGRGGSDERENLVGCCVPCNIRKAYLTEPEYRLLLETGQLERVLKQVAALTCSMYSMAKLQRLEQNVRKLTQLGASKPILAWHVLALEKAVNKAEQNGNYVPAYITCLLHEAQNSLPSHLLR